MTEKVNIEISEELKEQDVDKIATAIASKMRELILEDPAIPLNRARSEREDIVWSKRLALENAIEYLKDKPSRTAEEVVATAATFYAFLNDLPEAIEETK